MNGQTLQEVFPILFGLSRRKNISVRDAMHNGRWMKGLQRINLPEQIDRFVELWNKVQLVHLTEDLDSITWTKTPDGAYSASSAYTVCFSLHTLKLLLVAVWEVKTKGKIKFFLWLIMQNCL
jgi:hypothetical protein